MRPAGTRAGWLSRPGTARCPGPRMLWNPPPPAQVLPCAHSSPPCPGAQRSAVTLGNKLTQMPAGGLGAVAPLRGWGSGSAGPGGGEPGLGAEGGTKSSELRVSAPQPPLVSADLSVACSWLPGPPKGGDGDGGGGSPAQAQAAGGGQGPAGVWRRRPARAAGPPWRPQQEESGGIVFLSSLFVFILRYCWWSIKGQNHLESSEFPASLAPRVPQEFPFLVNNHLPGLPPAPARPGW